MERKLEDHLDRMNEEKFDKYPNDHNNEVLGSVLQKQYTST